MVPRIQRASRGPSVSTCILARPGRRGWSSTAPVSRGIAPKQIHTNTQTKKTIDFGWRLHQALQGSPLQGSPLQELSLSSYLRLTSYWPTPDACPHTQLFSGLRVKTCPHTALRPPVTASLPQDRQRDRHVRSGAQDPHGVEAAGKAQGWPLFCTPCAGRCCAPRAESVRHFADRGRAPAAAKHVIKKGAQGRVSLTGSPRGSAA